MVPKKLLTTFLLMVLIFVSGCVSITVQQELYKDGTSDVDISVNSDSSFLTKALQKEMEKTLAVDNAVLKEESNGFTYEFERVVPNKEVLPEQEEDDRLLNDSNLEREGGLFYTTFRLELSGGLSDYEAGNASQTEGPSLGDGFQPSFNYEVKPFGTITDTNGQKMEDGYIRFDLTENKDHYVEFQTVSATLLWNDFMSEDPCVPEWECDQWSNCSGGERNRSCTDINNCDNYMYSPQETKSCSGSSVRNETTFGSFT